MLNDSTKTIMERDREELNLKSTSSLKAAQIHDSLNLRVFTDKNQQEGDETFLRYT